MKSRNMQIDGLRGLIAIMIVVFHLFCRYIQIYENGNIEWMSEWGNFGVTVFIIISGYFLGVGGLQESNTFDDFRLTIFLRKKIMRLWPCYVMSITITMIAVKVSTVGLPGRECSWLEYLLNVIFINGFIGIPYVDGAHWYLTTLIAIVAITGILIKLRLHGFWFIHVIWIAAVFAAYRFGYAAIAGIAGGVYAGAAMVGISLARFLTEKEKHAGWLFLLGVSAMQVILILGVQTIKYIVISIILLILCLNGKLGFLEHMPFSFLGMISYPLYLIHQNMGFLFIRIMEDNGEDYKVIYSFIAFIAVIFLSAGLQQADRFVRYLVKARTLS